MTLDINRLETSFAQIKPHANKFSDDFYKNLFIKYPELEILFQKTSLENQEKKLIASLALIIENLHNPNQLSLALKSLGAYHVGTGTLTEHYPFVGQALLETLALYLAESWTSEMEQAWLNAYTFISEVMLEGAENPQQYLGGELTFYEWLDLYGESSPSLRDMVADVTNFKYGKQSKGDV
ncbi:MULTISPECIES: globin family protein [unclassified Coleofasciculus]|uniref:globin family protein n=1 Tax=unclassified Coleofasciculus TaxID=2692782 RepID=UPI00187DF862|nr:MULTISPECIES: globin family protein [unclassified Coleofasciculus]MBE9128656.1 flavohemoprotein [Coleofasciculus sp. LEGE 07081]MBE9149749.1 flavohemoprotein [Coleofasciculus sp. LEGE 07092]